MNRIANIDNGCGISFTIIQDNKKVNYTLTLVEEKNWWKKDEKGKLGFIFISNCGKYYTNGVYSGGNTGFGISNYNIYQTDNEEFKENYKILTSDLTLMGQLAEAETLWDEVEREHFHKSQKARVERINKLPDSFDTVLKDFIFVRFEAEYREGYSQLIQGRDVFLKKRDNLERYRNLFTLANYKTKSGKLRIKDFTKTFADYLDGKDAREVLTTLLAQQKEIKTMIENA